MQGDQKYEDGAHGNTIKAPLFLCACQLHIYTKARAFDSFDPDFADTKLLSKC